MTGNAPVYCFTIPSLHDSTVLDCRIYHPASLQDAQTGQQRTRKAALVAHPYAPLGGCMDDPVVMTIVDQLIDLDFVVGTFNFRYCPTLHHISTLPQNHANLWTEVPQALKAVPAGLAKRNETTMSLSLAIYCSI